MGLFSKKITIDQAAQAILDIASDESNRVENLIFLRSRKEGDDLVMKDGTISGRLDTLPKMLVEAARGDDNFARALITASETVKHNIPAHRQFSDDLTQKKSNPMGGIKDALKEKFPGAEIMSIDITKLDEMKEGDFDDLIDKIYKASQRGNDDSGPSQD